MASLVKQSKRRCWYAAYRDNQGSQHLISTRIEHTPEGTDDRARMQLEAANKRLAQDLANQLEEAERGHAVEAHLRKVLSDISQRVNQRRLAFAMTRTFLEDWLDRAAKTRAETTAIRYRGTVENFLSFLGQKADGPLSNVTPQDLQKYAESRLAGGRNLTTITVDLKTLNAPFAVALKQGLILTNPVQSVDMPTGAQESHDIFTSEELGRLLETATGEWKTAVTLGVFTGQRLGDCVSLVWGNFDLANRLLILRPEKIQNKKQDWILPLHAELEEYVHTLPHGLPDQFLCPELAKAPIGGRSGLSRQFLKIMDSAGVAKRTVAARGEAGRSFNKLSFQSLRHSYISLLANAGVPSEIRQKLSAHFDPKVHARYTHHELKVLREAMDKLPRFHPISPAA